MVVDSSITTDIGAFITSTVRRTSFPSGDGATDVIVPLKKMNPVAVCAVAVAVNADTTTNNKKM
jgi:hypothetical protein